jgi:hypothetical protein
MPTRSLVIQAVRRGSREESEPLVTFFCYFQAAESPPLFPKRLWSGAQRVFPFVAHWRGGPGFALLAGSQRIGAHLY